MKEYDKKFHLEIEAILNELYYGSVKIGDATIKRKSIATEGRYVAYLEKMELITRIKGGDGQGKWGMQLALRGYEVFEKYGGWPNYKKKVIDKELRIQNSKKLAVRYWWVPVIISGIGLIISIVAFTGVQLNF